MNAVIVAITLLAQSTNLAGSPGEGPALRAAVGPPDLAFHGPVRIGRQALDWGQITTLPSTDAIRTDAGHCRFTLRFAVVNQGRGPAPASTARVLLDNTVALADIDVGPLAAGATQGLSTLATLWTGDHVLYVQLDADGQVQDADPSSNLRRIGLTVGEGCPDPRPRARPPSGSSPRTIPPPPGVHRPAPTGSRASTPAPAQGGSRAAPPEGRPAPGSGKPAPGTSKPVPADGRNCKAPHSATRTLGATRSGARASAIVAWEAYALAQHGPGHRWEDAEDTRTECSQNVTWTCTASARPCPR